MNYNMHYHQIHHPIYKNNKLMLKRVILDENIIKPFFSPKISFRPKDIGVKKVLPKEKFKIGNIYSLKGVECDDFNMPKKEYELVGIISKVNDINIDSVVMKQVSGEKGTIFSLTKSDCRLLNIDFQQGLQLFPKTLDWQEVKTNANEKKEIVKENNITSFDENNLSTYPINYEDKTIRHIMLEIRGCNFLHNGNFIVMPNGDKIEKSIFKHKLHVRTKRPLYGNGNTSSMFKANEAIEFRIMTSEISTCTTNEVVDSNGNIYIELSLVKKQIFPNKKTLDGNIGVHPSIFDNQSLNEVFELSYIIDDGNNIKNEENINVRKQYHRNNDLHWHLPNVNYNIDFWCDSPKKGRSDKKYNDDIQWIDVYDDYEIERMKEREQRINDILIKLSTTNVLPNFFNE